MRSKRDEMNDNLKGILSDVVRKYISFIADSYKIRSNYRSRKGTMHYGFVPSSTEEVLEVLFELYYYMGGHSHQHSFLDIGCGIGNIVLLAHKVGFDAYGLEYNKKIYDVAKRFMGKNSSMSKNHIFKGDMTCFRNYSKYDVLYYYVPIINAAVMHKFITKLSKAVKPGAYIIPQGYGNGFYNSKEFENIKLRSNACYPIFRKKGK